MNLTPEQLKEIEERSEKSGWDDIHGYEAVKLHQDHEALLEEVRRLRGLEEERLVEERAEKICACIKIGKGGYLRHGRCRLEARAELQSEGRIPK